MGKQEEAKGVRSGRPARLLPKSDESRLVDEYMMLLQTPNGGKVIVDTRPALIRQDAKTAPIAFLDGYNMGAQDADRDNKEEWQVEKERIKKEIEACDYPICKVKLALKKREGI